jgi:hypothetical protein
MFSGKMSFYPGALAPGNLNLASPLLTVKHLFPLPPNPVKSHIHVCGYTSLKNKWAIIRKKKE